MLKLIERKSVPIDNPYSPASQIQEELDRQRGKTAEKQDNMVSTENILFGLGGSFERTHDNLEVIVKKRLQHKGRVHEDGSIEIRGFSSQVEDSGKNKMPSSNFKKLKVNRKLCECPRDYLSKLQQKLPFVDYVEYFKNEYGIELVLDEDVQNYFEQYASDHNIQISEALKNLLHGASALNYMGIIVPFRVTKETIQDETYFDRLFSSWYQGQKRVADNQIN